ncbi:G-protein coupled receptor 83-like [Petaurus breviceps papuanus]|uniref:G-protein coupled receptor 83-like n=1 Tax=Petaurus breviceps papuanus TaxID=3040969 RepID=UPI0036DA62DA
MLRLVPLAPPQGCASLLQYPSELSSTTPAWERTTRAVAGLVGLDLLTWFSPVLWNRSTFSSNSSTSSNPWDQPAVKEPPKWGTPMAKVRMMTLLAYAFAVAFSLFGDLKLCQMFIRHPLVSLAADRLIHQIVPVDLVWSLFAMPFSMVLENNRMTTIGRILCFIFRLVHFSLSAAMMTLAFTLLDLPQPILPPLTLGTMMSKHLMRVAVIWTLAIAVSFPRFTYQNLYLISPGIDLCRNQNGEGNEEQGSFVPPRENLWMPHLPEILDSDWLVMKIIKIVITSVYFLVPLLLSTKAFLIMTRVQLLTIAAEMRFLELEDVVPPAPNRRKTLALLLVLVVGIVIFSFPLSFYVAVIASADAEAKSAVFSACQWFALINQRPVQFAHCGLENFENNMRLIVADGQLSPKVHVLL